MTRVWVLRRPRGVSAHDDPRLLEIHGHEEIVHPIYDSEADAFVARVRFETTRDRLMRRHGFEVIGDGEEAPEGAPEQAPIVELPLEPKPAPGPPAYVHGTEWAQSLARRMGAPIVPRDGAALLRRCRAPVRGDVLAAAARAAEALAVEERERLGRGLGIVLTVTGWGAMEESALRAAVGHARMLGAQLSLVRNDEEATKEWAEFTRRAAGLPSLRVSVGPNDGFASACRLGFSRLRGARSVLFTQADARWSADAAVRGCALSEVLASEPTGFGRPAVVGPSGGCVVHLPTGQLAEVGAQGPGAMRGVLPVDWVAGYWFLVDAEAYRAAGGWDDGFFLYYEDPDLSMRLALAGSRPFAWPALDVEHARSMTCRARLSAPVIEAMRFGSRARFLARWAVTS